MAIERGLLVVVWSASLAMDLEREIACVEREIERLEAEQETGSLEQQLDSFEKDRGRITF